ncbi:MAG: hypothetical protein JO128_13200 [Alphaproteobacteria bacterium]|nr:hypothetical protein [Alphaproteobacteria bacterium]
MAQSLSVYWHRLTHLTGDPAERLEAPLLDLAGCFGTSVTALRPVAMVARLGDAGPARPEQR